MKKGLLLVLVMAGVAALLRKEWPAINRELKIMRM